MADRVEGEMYRLYGLPLEEFVRQRDLAAREARNDGDRESASAISALRKPTAPAWVVNQLARSSRREIDLLLDSGKRLVEAQRAALEAGDQAALDRARADLEKAVEHLSEVGKRTVADQMSDTTLGRVVETLRASAISPAGRELLARGTFVREASGTGWDVLASLTSDLPGRRSKPAKEGSAAGSSHQASEQRRPSGVAEPEAGRNRAAELRSALREARSERADKARAVTEARRRQAAAERGLELARRELETAERELAEAGNAIEAAQQSLQQAASHAERSRVKRPDRSS